MEKGECDGELCVSQGWGGQKREQERVKGKKKWSLVLVMKL